MFFLKAKDKTPVCTTEMAAAAINNEAFAKRNVKLIGLSVDSVDDHKAWIPDIEDEAKGSKVGFPIIADADRAVSKALDMLDQDSEQTTAETVCEKQTWQTVKKVIRQEIDYINETYMI